MTMFAHHFDEDLHSCQADSQANSECTFLSILDSLREKSNDKQPDPAYRRTRSER